MRFIHTADWHLGRVLHGASLLEDQAHLLLSQLILLAREEKPDAVIIAGDVYDRAIPPAEAIELLDDVLCRLVLDQNINVILIAGNHDSPERLNFGSRLMAGKGLHIRSGVDAVVSPVIVTDIHGPVFVYPLPYAEPALVRFALGDPQLQSHQAALEARLDALWRTHPAKVRTVAAAHCFVGGTRVSESERPLGIGGIAAVEAALFRKFDYTALGHLHRPQCCEGRQMWYSGSLMRYAFSEADHSKAVMIVDMDERGRCLIRQEDMVPRRQVRRLEGFLNDVVTAGRLDKAKDDYIMVNLLDRGPVFDAMGKLREVYPNILYIERPVAVNTSGDASRIDHRKLSEMDLFRAFVMEVTGTELTGEQEAAYGQLIDKMQRSEREAPQ